MHLLLSCSFFVISFYLEAHPNKFTVRMLETPLRVGVPFQVYDLFHPLLYPVLRMRGCSSLRKGGRGNKYVPLDGVTFPQLG